MDEMNVGKQEEPKQPVEKPEGAKAADVEQDVQEAASTSPAEVPAPETGKEEAVEKADAVPKEDADKGKKPWWKRLLKWLGWTCIVLLVLILLLPTLLSLGVTRNVALNIVNGAIAPAKVEIADWSFGWFTKQSVEGIHYRDETKGVDAQVKSVRLSSLWKLIPLGQMTVDVEVDSPAVAASLFTIKLSIRR